MRDFWEKSIKFKVVALLKTHDCKKKQYVMSKLKIGLDLMFYQNSCFASLGWRDIVFSPHFSLNLKIR